MATPQFVTLQRVRGTGVNVDASPRRQVNACPGFGACPPSRMNEYSPRCQACYLTYMAGKEQRQLAALQAKVDVPPSLDEYEELNRIRHQDPVYLANYRIGHQEPAYQVNTGEQDDVPPSLDD